MRLHDSRMRAGERRHPSGEHRESADERVSGTINAPRETYDEWISLGWSPSTASMPPTRGGGVLLQSFWDGDGGFALARHLNSIRQDESLSANSTNAANRMFTPPSCHIGYEWRRRVGPKPSTRLKGGAGDNVRADQRGGSASGLRTTWSGYWSRRARPHFMNLAWESA